MKYIAIPTNAIWLYGCNYCMVVTDMFCGGNLQGGENRNTVIIKMYLNQSTV